MMLIDANLLLYAYNTQVEQHAKSKTWLERALSGKDLVGFAWLTLWAFLRIATHPRVFANPMTGDEARIAVSSWLSIPNTVVVDPGERHWEFLQELLGAGQATGPLMSDAALAAIAIEHGAILQTTDRDFSRFPGLKWINPIAER